MGVPDDGADYCKAACWVAEVDFDITIEFIGAHEANAFFVHFSQQLDVEHVVHPHHKRHGGGGDGFAGIEHNQVFVLQHGYHRIAVDAN